MPAKTRTNLLAGGQYTIAVLLSVILLMFAFGKTSNAQSKSNIEKRVSNLFTGKIELDSLKMIIKDMVHLSDTAFYREQLEKIIKATSREKNSKTYLFSLKAYGQLNNSKTLPYLNEAYKIARENNYEDLLIDIIDTKGTVFKERGMSDSLFVTLLEAKDIYEKNNNEKELVTTLHATADLYYNLKLYDSAEKIYLEILKRKGDLSEWKYWRNVVIVNDLGLIAMDQDKYEKALKYFNQSLDIIKKDSSSSRFTVELGYNSLLFANLYQKMGKDSLSYVYYKKGLENCRINKMYNEVIWLYIINSKLFFNKGKIDSSLFYTNKAYEIWKKNSISKTRLLSIYKSYYKIFNRLKNYKKANSFLNLFVTFHDSLNTATNSARYMQVLAESDYQREKEKLSSLETKNYFLLTIAISVFIFLMILSLFYFRLRSAHLKLVEKNIEIASVNRTLEKKEKKGISPNNSITKTISSKQIELFENFENYMKNEKAYLKNDISINYISHQLNTNRTYLSNAINACLKKSFIAYINELRIKEAVNRITLGQYKEMTIEGIAIEVGFNNRVSFNTAFKKYTGVLPSYFLSEISKR